MGANHNSYEEDIWNSGGVPTFAWLLDWSLGCPRETNGKVSCVLLGAHQNHLAGVTGNQLPPGPGNLARRRLPAVMRHGGLGLRHAVGLGPG